MRAHWLQVGYMGVPYLGGDMTSHLQYVVVRNERGKKLLDSVRGRLVTQPTISTGDRKPLVMQVCGGEGGPRGAHMHWCLADACSLCRAAHINFTDAA